MPYTLTLDADEYVALIGTLEDARSHYALQAKGAQDHPDATIPEHWIERAKRAGILLSKVAKLRSA